MMTIYRLAGVVDDYEIDRVNATRWALAGFITECNREEHADLTIITYEPAVGQADNEATEMLAQEAGA